MYSKILISVAALLCLTSLCLAVDADWSDCGSEDGSDSGSLINVVVKDCDEKRCKLVRGQNASLEITFKSKIATKSVNATVFGEVLGYKQKFNLPNPLACEEVGLTCPLAPESTYTYKNSVFVKPNYPRVTVEIFWELFGEDGSRLFCALIPAKIVQENKQ